MQRLAKYISSCGFCSRRDAEKLIEKGRVRMNGIDISDVVTFVSDNDVVEVDNIILSVPKTKLWIYYKPRGLVTTHKDPQNRPTVFDNLTINSSHIISIGRLDIDSEGLLLLTNNGELARKYELPSNNYSRVYKVKAYGSFKKEDLKKLELGPEIDGIKYAANKIEFIKSNSKNHWFQITIFEGKNREVRKLFNHIGLQVNRLIRVSYGEYELNDMKPGQIKEVISNH